MTGLTGACRIWSWRRFEIQRICAVDFLFFRYQQQCVQSVLVSLYDSPDSMHDRLPHMPDCFYTHIFGKMTLDFRADNLLVLDSFPLDKGIGIVLTQNLYWHSPLWEVLLIVVSGLVVAALIGYQMFRPLDTGAVLEMLHPAFGQQPLFLYGKIEGLRALNEPANQLVFQLQGAGDESMLDILLDIMSESMTEVRQLSRPAWPNAQQEVLVVPLYSVAGAAALATVIALPETSEDIDDSGVAAVGQSSDISSVSIAYEDDAWLCVGHDLRIHLTRPLVTVQKIGNSIGAPEIWTEGRLTHLEDSLLRFLASKANETQSAEAIFTAVWPDDEVDSVGLRPDQKDRLRRLVFQLRKRVEPDAQNPRFLQTAHGFGYTWYSRNRLDVKERRND